MSREEQAPGEAAPAGGAGSAGDEGGAADIGDIGERLRACLAAVLRVAPGEIRGERPLAPPGSGY